MNKKYFINYICEVNFPNTSAYGLHVLKMCDAFSSIKYKVNLFIPSLSINQHLLKKNYNIKNKINFLPIYKNKKKLIFLLELFLFFEYLIIKLTTIKKLFF